jgi:predicted transcriptional regulator of viral defense system
MPKKQESRQLFIQLVKKGKMDRLGYSLYWAKDIRLKDEEVYYYTDYVMVSERGVYIMKVYSKDKPTKPLAMNEFYVY